MNTDQFMVYVLISAAGLAGAYGAMRLIDLMIERWRYERHEVVEHKVIEDDQLVGDGDEAWEPAPQYLVQDPLSNPPAVEKVADGDDDVPPYAFSPDVALPGQQTMALVPHELMAGDKVDEATGRHHLERVGGETGGR